MSYLFPSDRTLLYPQFETYKLQSLDPENDLSTFNLPEPGSTQSRIGYNSSSHLSFKEVRNRIGWDHLSVNQDGKGIYIDKDWGVIGFTINDDLVPTFSKLASLPVPISSSDQPFEFPSVTPLTSSKWAISSGSGSLYILSTSSHTDQHTQEGEFIARYDISSIMTDSPSKEPSPFLLRASHTVSEDEVNLLITRSIRPSDTKRNITSAQLTKFELIEITLNPNLRNEVDDQQSIDNLKVNWKLLGGDLPIHCYWSSSKDTEGGWVVLSSEGYKLPINGSENAEESEIERTKREREEKISKLGLGASLSPSTSTEAELADAQKRKEDTEMDVEEEENKVYPYSWTQNSDSINMIIPIPKEIKREDIQLILSSTTFSFSISNTSSIDTSYELDRFLSKKDKAFWAEIDSELSRWIFDSTRNQIEIDLTKIDQNVRWPSIFSVSADNDEDDGDGEEEVPETLSTEMLESVRQSFNSIKTRNENEDKDEPMNPHPAIPALLREEMDFDLDDDEAFGENAGGEYDELSGGSTKVGKEVLIGYITKSRDDDGSIVSSNWSKTSTSILSTPLTGSTNQSNRDQRGIIIKSAVDGLLFDPPTNADISKNPWKHISTNPALAFVLSSKKDLRLIKHLTTISAGSTEIHPHENVEPTSPSSSKRQKPSTETQNIAETTVLAFDSGSSIGQGNLYIYYPPGKGDRNVAKQGVIPVSGGEKGALLGVGAVTVKGKQVVVILTEKSLVLLKNVV
ncbi:uncharacterized protein L201_004400 [Kwoniella dendrophila CBS 6074]|uniref:NudC domain-containing protein 1 n=1 Tax=Kwoniella dendrophila CBS 6074 TaxID=1295534 RepID=A0AAX4JVL2_9TREE